MKSSLKARFCYVAAAVLLTTALSAQGPQGPQGPNPGAPAACANCLNVAAASTITGKITAVQVAYGAQYPSITLDGKTIKIAPVWFLLENDFELAAGDEVRVLAAPSLRAGDPALYAISITKLAANVTLAMRNESGIPLWTAPGRGNPNPAAGGSGTQNRVSHGAGCVDPSTIATVQGVIDAVSQGAGIQQPQLTLNAGDKSLTFKIGPESLILAAGIELKPGMTITVRYATATCTGELVALSLADASGVVILLRNDDGTPAWN